MNGEEWLIIEDPPMSGVAGALIRSSLLATGEAQCSSFEGMLDKADGGRENAGGQTPGAEGLSAEESVLLSSLPLAFSDLT